MNCEMALSLCLGVLAMNFLVLFMSLKLYTEYVKDKLQKAREGT